MGLEMNLRKPNFPIEEYAHPIDVSHAHLLVRATLFFQPLHKQRTLFVGKECGILRETGENEERKSSIRDAEAAF